MGEVTNQLLQCGGIEPCTRDQQHFYDFFSKSFKQLGYDSAPPFKVKQLNTIHEGVYHHKYFMIKDDRPVDIMFIAVLSAGAIGVIIEEDKMYLHYIQTKIRGQGIGTHIMNMLKHYCDQTDRKLILYVEPIALRQYIENKHKLEEGLVIGKKLVKVYNRMWTNEVNGLIKFYTRQGLTRVKQPVSMGIEMQYINNKNNKLQ